MGSKMSQLVGDTVKFTEDDCVLNVLKEIDLRDELKDTEFTHIIQSTVCLKVTKGDATNAVIKYTTSDAYLSLDCYVCKRIWRSAVFAEDGAVNCTGSTGHKTGFPGQITKIENFIKDNSLILNRITILFRWEPFTSSKYPNRKSTKFGLSSGRHSFVYSCKHCGKAGNKQRWDYETYGGSHGMSSKMYYECQHIQLMGYGQEPGQPWRIAKEVTVNPIILKEILQDALKEQLPHGVIDIISDLVSGYW